METIFFVLTSEVIGRDEEKKRIVKMLTHDDPAEEDIPVLSIVRIRGLGKIALTKLVFNDAAVDAHFELKQWEVLQECLNGKKYLLILDNVWNEDNRKWVEFKNLLVGGASGRRIVVTTRSNRGAEITGTIPCHYYEKSLSLFLKFAFKKGKEKQHPNLAKIGQAIVKKCQGIPLVVKVLGSSLFFKTSEQEWTLVRDSKRWKLMEKDNEIYLNELLSGSFFQDYDEGYIFDTFKMHHLFHDLALSVSTNECCAVNSFEENTAPGIRHMWLINFNQNPSEFLNRFGHLRSLRLPDFNKSFIETCLKRFLDLSNFPNIKKLPNSLCELHELQTLNFHGCGQIEELPKYMRYMLDLSRTQGFQEKVEEVVEDGSANTLKNLIIADCVNLTTLVEWHNLTSVKKLAIIHCLQLSSLPNNMQRLKQLKIEYCPLLSQRCQQGTGVDWLNIAHASFIVLDGNAISANDN
ncbi:hypothetical protein Golob_022846 [Gossypium lobatum]|uniref:NB-ARC domain-containing protein n=1 Tax=Gossypium lobatum TaxID=34289 RepID=A0A7J8LIB5_9ROSI|nr:hypothetical protein [Gossypium lobatum]